jgi:hypothetical protein
MGVERGSEALYEAHRPQPATWTAAAFAQAGLHHAQQDVQDGAERFGIALQEVAQALGDR